MINNLCNIAEPMETTTTKKVIGCEENVYPAVICVTISVCVKHHSRATVQRQRNKGNGLDKGEL